MGEGSKQNLPDPSATATTPIVTIYQNSEQVAGILQQVFESPLLTNERRESGVGEASTVSGAGALEAVADVRATLIPGLLGVDGRGTASGRLDGSRSESRDHLTQQEYAYTQAYNLHRVRAALESAGLVHEIAGDEDPLTDLSIGGFVEYQARFDPVELTLMLDVFTPALVSGIARFMTYKQWGDSYPEPAVPETVRAHAEKMNVDASEKAALAGAVADAFVADTRRGTTREYYGRIGDLTVVTVCENAHFMVEDPDRLLDGSFTVLGKVISTVEEDVPTFARNKVLRNVSADAFDEAIDKLTDAVSKASTSSTEELLDLRLTSRIRGRSFRVLPIAIYV